MTTWREMHIDEMELAAYVEGKLPRGDRQVLEAHLKACSTCRAEVEAFRALYEALPGTELPDELLRRLGEEPRPPRRPHREHRYLRIGYRMALVAVVMLLAVLGFLRWQHGTPVRLERGGEGETIVLRMPPPEGTWRYPEPFRWEAQLEAQGYLLRFYTEDGKLIGRFYVDSTAFLPPDSLIHVFQSGQVYYWQVEALDPVRGGVSSSLARFVVGRGARWMPSDPGG